MTKRCSCCKTSSPLDAFNRDRSSPDGRHHRCRKCEKEQKAAYYRANKDRVLARNAAHYTANKCRVLAQQTSYYEANRRRLLAQQAAYRRANPHVVLAAKVVRRQALRRRMQWYDQTQVRRIYSTAAWLRALGLPIHVDHTLPLRGKQVCGLHVQGNLRLAYARQNMSKGARHWPSHNGPVLGQFLPVDLRGQARWLYPLTST